MVTSAQAKAKFGDPYVSSNEAKFMTMWQLTPEMQSAFSHVTIFGTKGLKKIYCNIVTKPLLEKAFKNIIDRKLTLEFKTYDGCHALRKKRGQSSLSLHCWGLPIDLNASTNAFGAKPTLSSAFVKCFTDVGFDWGGTWSKPDGMHFQPTQL